MRHRRRTAVVAGSVVLALAAGGFALVLRDDDRGPQGPLPDRLQLDGEAFRQDHVQPPTQLRLDPADPARLLVITSHVIDGIPSSCQRRTLADIVQQDDERVVLASYEYRRVDRVEADCPQPDPVPVTLGVELDAPLGDRDVVVDWDVEGTSTLELEALFVQDRRVPGRTPPMGEPSCGAESLTSVPSTADYGYYLQHDGREYFGEAGAPRAAVELGELLGRVRCRLEGTRTPFDYEPVDGDASLFPIGAPYFELPGTAPERAVVLRYGGQYFVLRHDPQVS